MSNDLEFIHKIVNEETKHNAFIGMSTLHFELIKAFEDGLKSEVNEETRTFIEGHMATVYGMMIQILNKLYRRGERDE